MITLFNALKYSLISALILQEYRQDTFRTLFVTFSFSTDTCLRIYLRHMQTPFRTSVLKYLHRVTELQMPYGSYNIFTQRYTFRGTQIYVYFETRKVGCIEESFS